MKNVKVTARNAYGEEKTISVNIPDEWHPSTEKPPVVTKEEGIRTYIIMLAECENHNGKLHIDYDLGYYSLCGEGLNDNDWTPMNDWYEGQFIFFIAWKELPPLGEIEFCK